MKIIKRGQPPTHEFTCDRCKTIFEAEGEEFEIEYRDDSHLGYEGYYSIIYTARCPVCGGKVTDIV